MIRLSPEHCLKHLSGSVRLRITVACLLLSVVRSLASSTEVDLQQCIQLALEKNFQIRYHQLQQSIEQESIAEAEGKFDPVLGMRYGRSEVETLNASDGWISESQAIRQTELSIRGQIPTGTRYQLTLREGSERISIPERPTSAQYQPVASIEVIQPLLRGGYRNEARTAVRASRVTARVEFWRFRAWVLETVLAVVETYADLHLASEQLQIAVNNRELAAQLLTDNQKRVSLGYQAESDIILAESRSAQRQDVVFQAELNLHFQQNRLKQLISDEALPLLSLAPTVAALPELQAFQPVVIEEYDAALDANPLFQAAQLGTEIQELLLMQKRFDLLPTLDLTLRYDAFGLRQDASSAWSDLGDGAGENWYGGLEVSIPIPNRSRRAQSVMAALSLRQSEIQLDEMRQAVLLQLDHAAFQVSSYWERMRASQHNRELAERSLAAEEKKLKAGRSTSFFVLDQQQRVADAQLQEIRSQVDYFKSLARYFKINGTLLERYSINLPTPEGSD